MAAGFRSASFPLGLSNAPPLVGYRGLFAFWIGGAATTPFVPPVPVDETTHGWPSPKGYKKRKKHDIEEVPDIVAFVEQKADAATQFFDTHKLQKQLLRGRFGEDIVLPEPTPLAKTDDDDEDELIILSIL